MVLVLLLNIFTGGGVLSWVFRYNCAAWISKIPPFIYWNHNNTNISLQNQYPYSVYFITFQRPTDSFVPDESCWDGGQASSFILDFFGNEQDFYTNLVRFLIHDYKSTRQTKSAFSFKTLSYWKMPYPGNL